MKDFDKIISISRMPGLYYLESTRNNGLVVTNLENSEKIFVSVRKHQFSPLRSLAIFTYNDSLSLEEIFSQIDNFEEQEASADVLKTDDSTLKKYFRKIMPEYDEDRVAPKDMKKVLRWYNFLKSKDLLNLSKETTVDRENKEEEE